MSLSLPASMQEIVGHRFLRIGTSYNNTRFFIDIPAARDNSNRNRYGYEVENGILGSYNLDKLLGAKVLSIYLDDTEDVAKIVFTTNPTGVKVEYSILYITYSYSSGTSFLLTEVEDYILQENGFRLILENGSTARDSGLVDEVINKDIFSATESETKFFIVQENDF